MMAVVRGNHDPHTPSAVIYALIVQGHVWPLAHGVIASLFKLKEVWDRQRQLMEEPFDYD